MIAKQKIQMTFMCDQDWDTMKATEKGRYCNLCKQEVFDFSTKSITEINSIKVQKGEVCGNFRIDQVEEGLYPIQISLFKKTKYWLATFSTIFGLEIAQVKGQNKNEILTVYTDSIKSFKENSMSNIQCDTTIDSIAPPDSFSNKKPFISFAKNKFYWTKKFPFIVKRKKHHIRGKF